MSPAIAGILPYGRLTFTPSPSTDKNKLVANTFTFMATNVLDLA